MGNFYSGFGGHKSYLGYCEDGIVYSGRTPIGRYENGNIYNQFKEHVGSYGGGSIYDAFGTHIASYDGGCVYNKYLNAVVGKEQVGSYEDNPAEAAALVLLFLGGNSVNDDDKDRDIHISDDSDTGCLGALFYVICTVIGGLLKLLWSIFKLLFLYYCIPAWAGMTWIAFLPTVFLPTGIIPLAIASVIAAGLCFMAFWPYGIMVIVLKLKKQITTKEQLSMYGKWFLKGPFAYVDMLNLLNETNTMPKIAHLLGKIIEWFKKVFKKNEKV